MAGRIDYKIHLDEKFGPKTLIDVAPLVKACRDQWFNQTLCRVNDCVVRLGIARAGEFPWHVHEREDEFFLVEGTLYLDFEDRTFELHPGQACVVAKGERHRTRAPKRAVYLMVEGATVQPLGDKAGGLAPRNCS